MERWLVEWLERHPTCVVETWYESWNAWWCIRVVKSGTTTQRAVSMNEVRSAVDLSTIALRHLDDMARELGC